MDAVTQDLNAHIAQLDADDALESWRQNKAKELVEDYLRGEELYDTAESAAAELDDAMQSDDDCYLFQLIVAAMDTGCPKLTGLAKPFYDIIRAHAERLAGERADTMNPEPDDEV